MFFLSEWLRSFESGNEWNTAFFKRSVTVARVQDEGDEGRWVTEGRLRVLLGEEAEVAIANKWYESKPDESKGVNMYRYTEEFDVSLRREKEEDTVETNVSKLEGDAVQGGIKRMKEFAASSGSRKAPKKAPYVDPATLTPEMLAEKENAEKEAAVAKALNTTVTKTTSSINEVGKCIHRIKADELAAAIVQKLTEIKADLQAKLDRGLEMASSASSTEEKTSYMSSVASAISTAQELVKKSKAFSK